MCLALGAGAIPARQGVKTHVQPDGTVIEYELIGDEHGHAYFSTDGRLLKRIDDRLCYADSVSDGATAADDVFDRPRRVMRRALNIDNFPTTGSPHCLVLLVNFENAKMAPGHDVATYTRVMNEPGMADYGCTGSARDYFVEQSSGAFTPTFDVCGIIELDKPWSYYGENDWNGNDVHAQEMIVEACEKASQQFGVDFSKYDADGDGTVDFVYVFYAGYAESNGASMHTIWPHSSNLTSFDIDLEIDGKRIDRYACSSELDGVSGTTLTGIGTFCHEFCHVLGLPDLYNIINTMSIQLGQWSLMDQGSYNNNCHTPPNLSAWERHCLRWLDLTELSEPAYGVELPELTETNFGYIIKTDKENEFFVLENRQRRGWDHYLPGTGMLVYHIDFYRELWIKNQVNCNSYPLVDLIEADGLQDSSSSNDPFPGNLGNTMLTDYTYPSMMLHNGNGADRGLTEITEHADGLITFDFRHDRLKKPQLSGPSDLRANSFGVSWAPVPDAVGYKAYLTEVYPDDEKIEILSEGFALATEGTNPDADYNDIAKYIDSYTAVPGWSAKEIYQAGGWLRIGSYGNSGMLCTPALDAEGTATMVISACAYVGKKVDFTVELCDGATGEPYASRTFTSKRPVQTFAASFDNVKAGSRMRICTAGERLYVDKLRVVKGAPAEGEEWTYGQVDYEFDGITDTRYVFGGLKPNRTYKARIQALAAKELFHSLLSDELEVTTPASGGALVMRHGNSFDGGWGQAKIYTSFASFPAQFTAPYLGAKVTKVRFALNKPATNVRLYIKENPKDEDIKYMQKVGDLAAGWHEVTLDQPIDIDGTNMALGYRASFADFDGIGICDEDLGGTSYIFDNGTDKWVGFRGSLCIEAIVEGDNLPANEMKATSMANCVAPYGATSDTFSVKFRNVGTAKVESYAIEVTVDGGDARTYTYDCDVDPNFYHTATFEVPATTPGVYTVECRLVDTNGGPDAYAGNNTISASLTVRDPEFKRRLVLEEGTGLWCGNCPKGFVGLEMMKEEMPGEVLPVSIHGSDVMSIPNTYAYNYDAVLDMMIGFPVVAVNRRSFGDPYYDIRSMVEQNQYTDSPMNFTFDALWNADSTAIDITAHVKARVDLRANDYNMAFALLEDGISGYTQKNYYFDGSMGAMGGWENKPEHVTDLVFDDVARGIFPGVDGTGMLAADLPALQEADATFRFTIPVYDTTCDYAIADKKNLHLVGMVINNSTKMIETGYGAVPQELGSVSEEAIGGESLAMRGSSLVVDTATDALLVVYSLDGTAVLNRLLPVGRHTVNLELVHGIYIARLSTGQVLKIVL